MDKELQEQIEKLNEVLDKLIQDYTKNIAELGEAINSLTKTICQK